MAEYLGLVDQLLPFFEIHLFLLGHHNFVHFWVREPFPVISPFFELGGVVYLVQKYIRVDSQGGAGEHYKPHVVIMFHDYLLNILVIIDGIGLDPPSDLLEGFGTHPCHLGSYRIHGGCCCHDFHGIDYRSRRRGCKE